MSKVSTREEFQEVVKSGTVIIDFFATWCGPCKMMGPNFEAADQEMNGAATFLKVDIDELQELAVEHGVQSVPTLVIFKDGELVDRVIGVVSKDVLVEKVKNYV